MHYLDVTSLILSETEERDKDRGNAFIAWAQDKAPSHLLNNHFIEHNTHFHCLYSVYKLNY